MELRGLELHHPTPPPAEEGHPDKTFIGRIEKGFDFLGYHFSRGGLAVAGKTLNNFAKRIIQLYEQELSGPNGSDLLGQYVRRWTVWVTGGLGDLGISEAFVLPFAPPHECQAYQANIRNIPRRVTSSPRCDVAASSMLCASSRIRCRYAGRTAEAL